MWESGEETTDVSMCTMMLLNTIT